MGFTLQATQLENQKLETIIDAAFEENQMLREQIIEAASMIRAMMDENARLHNQTEPT